MKRPLFVTIVVILCLVLLGVLALIYWPRRDGKQPLTAERRLELLALKNQALGYLENGEFDKAEPLLRQLVVELPDDPLGYRNLAVALFGPDALNGNSSLDKSKPARLEEILATVEKLLKADSQPSAHQLAGRVFNWFVELDRVRDPAKYQQWLAKAREHYQKAADLAPQDPAPYFDLYEVEKLNDPNSTRTRDALDRARKRDPDNLVCLLEWLDQPVARGGPETRAVIEQVLGLLPADSPGKDDPRLMLQEAISELAKDPSRMPAGVAQASNLLKRHPVYVRDNKRLRIHPLAFVLHDFQPAFYDGLPPDAEPSAVAVKFEEVNLSEARDAKDVLLAAREDLNCDDTTFVSYTVLLRQGKDNTRVHFRPVENGAPFEAVEMSGSFTSFQLVDLDTDIKPQGDAKSNIPADPDLILYGPAGVRLFESKLQDNRRSWIDRTDEARLPDLKGLRWLLVCDMDHDGNLDLVAGLEKGVRIIRQRGDWVFEDVTARSKGLDELETRAAVFGDSDRDGDLDFFVLTVSSKMVFLENQRGGRFVPQDHAISIEKAATLSTFDADNDGLLDLAVGDASGVTLFFGDDRRRQPPREMPPLRLDAQARVLQLGVLDYDNDGRLDVWVVTDSADKPLRLFRNAASNKFEDQTTLLSPVQAPLRSVTVGDVDKDGDQDLLLAGPQGVQALRNDGGNKNRWLDIRLQAALDRDPAGQGQAVKCNYHNIGGSVEIKAGRHYQLRQVTGPVTHFGLGQRPRVDVVRSLWTNGVPQALVRPDKLNHTLTEDQNPKGSCPFLFTWDGERFVFVTDCLWSSALGMQLAHGVFMDHQRQENHLVIPGDKLQPRDGRYLLQFTNELWEVPYLDQAELWAIDHPADIDIYTNQRIPPDAKEPFRILTVKERRYPVAATDHRGRDVLSIINRRDAHYLGGFKRLRYVGLAEPHWLELDLGDLSQAKQVTLYFTGWIWPTDTSANVAISQDPRYSGPTSVIGGLQPPALLMPDGRGGWHTALPNMGFQSGKLQTVAVPVPLEKFVGRSLRERKPLAEREDHRYRVRIATAMELYWDEVFFTVDEPPVEAPIRKLRVSQADVHYRGYSRTGQASRSSPHLFDYDDVDSEPRWLPIPGPCTRYGEVTELLGKPDSQYVIMSPGDELTLEFPSLSPPAPGLKRSFIFYANGWLKDFDMNGSAGENIGPLPFDGMSRYPYPAGEYPAALDGFRREYLTREADLSRFWDQLKR